MKALGNMLCYVNIINLYYQTLIEIYIICWVIDNGVVAFGYTNILLISDKIIKRRLTILM